MQHGKRACAAGLMGVETSCGLGSWEASGGGMLTHRTPHVHANQSSLPRLSSPAPWPAGKVAGDGNITSLRDPWFVLVNNAVDASLASGGPLRGSLFWQVRAWAAWVGALNKTDHC